MKRAAIICSVWATAGYAWGCPVCDTETGAAVRSGIFNAAFLPTLLEVTSPFLVLAVVLRVLNRWLPQ